MAKNQSYKAAPNYLTKKLFLECNDVTKCKTALKPMIGDIIGEWSCPLGYVSLPKSIVTVQYIKGIKFLPKVIGVWQDV